MSSNSQSEILAALTVGLCSRSIRVRTFMKAVLELRSHSNKTAIIDTFVEIVRVTELQCARMSLSPETAEPIRALSEKMQSVQVVLWASMESIVRDDSPIRPWFNLGASAADWMAAQPQSTTKKQNPNSSDFENCSQSARKGDELALRYYELYDQLESEGHAPSEMLGKLRRKLPFLKQLLPLAMARATVMAKKRTESLSGRRFKIDKEGYLE